LVAHEGISQHAAPAARIAPVVQQLQICVRFTNLYHAWS